MGEKKDKKTTLLPDSLVQSVIEALLSSKLPLANKGSLVYFQHDV